VDSLSGFWFLRGQTIEGINWVNEALARAERFSYSQGETTHPQKLILAKAWQALTRLAFTNDNSLALKGSIACGALARQLGDIPMLVMSLTIEGTTRILLNDNEGASGAIEEAMKLARASGGKYELSWALGAMSEYYSMVRRDFNTARAYEEEGLVLLEGSETSWAAVHAFFTSARAAMLRGEYAAAQARFLKSLPAFEQVGDQHRVNMIGSELAHIDRYEGRYHQAEAAYRKTIRVWQRLGHRAAIAHQLESFGFVAKALGQPERAARLFAAAETLREKIGTPMNPQERIEYDGEVAGTRAQINENAFASAWAEGRNLTMEQAISYAVGDTPEAA
jgi:tetratricopeptide (TPR) repeat protein